MDVNYHSMDFVYLQFTKMIHGQSFWGITASFQPLSTPAGSKYRFSKTWSFTSGGQSRFLLHASDLTLFWSARGKSASQIRHLLLRVCLSPSLKVLSESILLGCTHSQLIKKIKNIFFLGWGVCILTTALFVLLTLFIPFIKYNSCLKSKIPIHWQVHFKLGTSALLIKGRVCCIAFLSICWTLDHAVLLGQKDPCIAFQDKQKD